MRAAVASNSRECDSESPEVSALSDGRESRYSLLPFRFLALDDKRFVATNFAGEYVVLPKDAIRSLIQHKLPVDSPFYRDLKAKHFLLDTGSTVAIDILAAKYRTKHSHLSQFTSLFMLVTTLRCDHTCTYCQVSGRSSRDSGCDMTAEVAEASVDFVLRSPSSRIKIEFQGGESLLHFGAVKHIVQAVKQRSGAESRDIEFVVATNLTSLTDNVFDFCKEHGVYVSTSLDGPRDLHNKNRPCAGRDSYEDAVQGIRRVQEILGRDRVSALMTTTRDSLSRAKDIVDEYVRQGLGSIFLRTLHPYGRASAYEAYSVEEWLAFYGEALAYIIKLNREGIRLREEFATILLQKILTPWSSGYVDLQSPAGIGIAGIVVNYDGNVYCSDEARMLAEMGDKTFLMGNVLKDKYQDIMLSEALLNPLEQTLTECMPQCSDCGIPAHGEIQLR